MACWYALHSIPATMFSIGFKTLVECTDLCGGFTGNNQVSEKSNLWYILLQCNQSGSQCW